MVALFPRLQSLSNYSLTGSVAQLFPVEESGSLSAVFYNVSLSLHVSCRGTTSLPGSSRHGKPALEVEAEDLQHESSELAVNSTRGETMRGQGKELDSLLFWKLAHGVATNAGERVRSCLSDLL